MTDFSRPVDSIVVDVPPEHAGQRIDSYLPRRFNWRSRAYFFGLLAGGSITVNEQSVKKAYRVRAGDRIAIALPESYRVAFDYDAIALELLYENDVLVAVNKPGNLAVQPTGRYIRENLLYRLRHHYRQQGDEASEPCIVHRLDRETSGVVVFAKSTAHAGTLAEQFASRTARKMYLAIVHGHPPPQGSIRQPLLATPDRHVVVDPQGKPALTHYRVRSHHGAFALVELALMTGRQHQLRVHLASIGHPIVSDLFYGKKEDRDNPDYPQRHMLHAAELCLATPEGQDLIVQAPLPEDMTSFLARLG